MSDHRVFSLYKASEIEAELHSVDVKSFKSNAGKRKHALHKIVANLTLGNYSEMSVLLPVIMQFWNIEDDMEVKRICHEYVRTFGSMKPQMVTEALPFISQDLKSKSDIVQQLALKTLLHVPAKDFTEVAFRFVESVLYKRTSSSTLTKVSISALLLLDEYDHKRVLPLMTELFDILDRPGTHDMSIKTVALHTLYVLHSRSNDMDFLNLDFRVVTQLLQHIDTMGEWDRGMLLESLPITVVPQTPNEVSRLLELVLPQLQHNNIYVSIGAMRFVLYLLNYMNLVDSSIIDRLSNSIISLIDKPAELEFLVLRNIILLLLTRDNSILNLDIAYFFIEYKDPIYIKDTKLECLYLSANSETLPRILEELEHYASDVDIQMSRKSIRAIGNLAVKLENEYATRECVYSLMSLLKFGVDFVIQEIISVLKNILRKYPRNFEDVARELVYYAEYAQENESKNAMIWIITHYSYMLDNSLELFQKFSSKIVEEQLDVQYSILNSAIKLFLRDPTKDTEAICLGVLKQCTEVLINPDIRNQAYYYWRLLTLAQMPDSGLTYESIRGIIDGESPTLQLNATMDPVILEELELNIGSIVSIYLKPASHIFSSAKIMQLPDSPILQRDKSKMKLVSEQSAEYRDTLSDLSYSGRNTPNSTQLSGPLRRLTMDDYDKPTGTVNNLKGKLVSSNKPSTAKRLTRSSSMLLRKMTIKRPFSRGESKTIEHDYD